MSAENGSTCIYGSYAPATEPKVVFRGGGGGGTLHLSLSYLFPESHSISLTVPLTFNWLIHCLIGGPVEVAVGFWVLSIDTINVVHMVSLKQERVKRPFEAGTL